MVGHIVDQNVRRFREHLRASPSPNLSPISKETRKWACPNHGVIKINCDAAVGLDKSFIAIVARDWRGELVFAYTKQVETNVPVQAEAEAFNWASQQVISHNISQALIEGNSMFLGGSQL